MRYLKNHRTDPYFNMAFDEYCLEQLAIDEPVFYLWQNRPSVIIGANQEVHTEVNIDYLKANGIALARRVTGGGAVYHDLGNLNFSFIADKKIYDVKRQMTVIQKALLNFGLETEVSGRNDITYQGRKFSGNAFAKTKYQGLHHGTIMIKTDGEKLQKYLKVKLSKLHKHGVKSVSSRVINLSEVADITSENIVPHLIKAFEEVYGNKAVEIKFSDLCTEEVLRSRDNISSKEYLFGKWKEFSTKKSATFDWGSVDIDLDIDEDKGIIKNIGIASDSLEPTSIKTAIELLKGASIINKPVFTEDNIIVKDIIEMIY